jgi:hypothetical protein
MTGFGLPKTVPYRPTRRPERNPLGRLIELTAAYEVLGAVPYAADAEGFKRKLSMLPRSELFTLTLHVLLRLPARRHR